MTTFLFCAVAVSGLAIINRGVVFNRRNRFILTAALAVGYGATLVPTYFEHVFTYSGPDRALQGFFDAISLIMETGFAVTAVLAMVLNLSLPEEIDEDDIQAVEVLDEGQRADAGRVPSMSKGPEETEVEKGGSL